ncbi:hypothetical protein BH09ACT10_BH09ACT10_23960 [soil metagenome]
MAAWDELWVLVDALVADRTVAQGDLVAAIERTQAEHSADRELDAVSAAGWVVALVGALRARLASDAALDDGDEVDVMRMIITRYLRPTGRFPT